MVVSPVSMVPGWCVEGGGKRNHVYFPRPPRTTLHPPRLLDSSRPTERVVDDERSPEHEAFGDEAPGTAVGAFGAVVAEAQVVAGLDVKCRRLDLAKRIPGFGIR